MSSLWACLLFSIIPTGRKYVCVCVWLGAGEMEREELGREVRNMYFKWSQLIVIP